MAIIDYFERKLDDKRRLTVPSEVRSEFSSGFVVTRGFKKYLHLYSLKVWKDNVEPLLVGDILDEKMADLNIQFRTGKSEGKIDLKQGRLMLEKHLLDYAGIKQNVIAVRAGKYWRLSAK